VDFTLVNYDNNAACHKTLYATWVVRKPILLMNKDELVFETLESILKTENLDKDYSYIHELFIK